MSSYTSCLYVLLLYVWPNGVMLKTYSWHCTQGSIMTRLSRLHKVPGIEHWLFETHEPYSLYYLLQPLKNTWRQEEHTHHFHCLLLVLCLRIILDSVDG